MKLLSVPSKPTMGLLNRTCLACGEPYYGWNYVLCHNCEDSDEEFLIKEEW